MLLLYGQSAIPRSPRLLFIFPGVDFRCFTLSSTRLKESSKPHLVTQKGFLVQEGDTFLLKDDDVFKVTRAFLRTGHNSRVHMMQGMRLRRTSKILGLAKGDPNGVHLSLYRNILHGLQEIKASEILSRTKLAFGSPRSPDLRSSSPVVAGTGGEDVNMPVCNWLHEFSTKPSFLEREKRKKEKHPPTDAFQPPAAHIDFARLVPMNSADAQRAIRSITNEFDQSPGYIDIPPSEDRGIQLESAMKELSVAEDDAHHAVGEKAAPSNITKTKSTAYTMGDAFCGCGGASAGARKAGLIVKWGLDHDEDACDSFRKNFPLASCFEMEIKDIGTIPGDQAQVDVLHISNPCQPFSKAKTRAGKNDAANIAASRSIGQVLDRAKPRIVTLENVAGLMSRKNGTVGEQVRQCLDEILRQFTDRAFSISWKLVNMADYGIPQYRERLLILAAGPGETLPPFPTPTHSAKPLETGLSPHVTLSESLGSLPASMDNDGSAKGTVGKPLDYGNRPSPTVTTKDPIRHPFGNRNLLDGEYAKLQGFEEGYEFSEWTVRRQIANAQPPIFGEILYSTVKQHLLSQDKGNGQP